MCPFTPSSTSDICVPVSNNHQISRALLSLPLSCPLYQESQLFRPQFPYLERKDWIKSLHFKLFSFCWSTAGWRLVRALSNSVWLISSPCSNPMEATWGSHRNKLGLPELGGLYGPFQALRGLFSLSAFLSIIVLWGQGCGRQEYSGT